MYYTYINKIAMQPDLYEIQVERQVQFKVKIRVLNSIKAWLDNIFVHWFDFTSIDTTYQHTTLCTLPK